MKNKKIFLDMDNVLALFSHLGDKGDRIALARFEKERGFFYGLPPIENHLNYKVKKLQEIAEVFIISACPHERAMADKRKWLEKHIPAIRPNNMFFSFIGENKAEKIQEKTGIVIDKNCFLFDDYGKNCHQWKEFGGVSIKKCRKFKESRNCDYQARNLVELRRVIKNI